MAEFYLLAFSRFPVILLILILLLYGNQNQTHESSLSYLVELRGYPLLKLLDYWTNTVLYYSTPDRVTSLLHCSLLQY